MKKQPLNLSTSQPLNLSTSQPLNLSTSQPLNLSTSQKPKNNFLKGIFHRLKRFSLNNKNSLYLFVLAGSYSCKSDSSSPTINTPPVAVNDVFIIDEDSPETSFTVITNDTDPENNTLVVSNVEGAKNGNVRYQDGNVFYTPNANFEGSETLRYTISDGNGETATAQLVVTVTGINDEAVITGRSTAFVIQGNNNLSTAIGNLNHTDVDNNNDDDQWQAQTDQLTSYGTYTIDANGNWTYNLDNSHTAVSGLSGSNTLADSFTVLTEDGTEQVISISINGASQSASITGTTTGTVSEDGTLIATADLAHTDPDSFNADDVWTSQTDLSSSYGTYSINIDGVWSYNLNNEHSAVQGLNTGQTLTDSFTVYTEDGTSQEINITINGQADAAIITGQATLTITEDYSLGVQELFSYTDVDNNNADNLWRTVTATNSSYGRYQLTISTSGGEGVFGYFSQQLNPDVQALNEGQSLTDSISIFTEDGTEQVIIITITGLNDASTITGDIIGQVTEDGSSSATGNLQHTDIDTNNTNDVWQVQSDQSIDYGSYSIDANGNWSYNLDNSHTDIQALDTGNTLIDSFTVLTEDGTEQVVSITINGVDEVASMSFDNNNLSLEYLSPLLADQTTQNPPIDILDNTATEEELFFINPSPNFDGDFLL